MDSDLGLEVWGVEFEVGGLRIRVELGLEGSCNTQP